MLEEAASSYWWCIKDQWWHWFVFQLLWGNVLNYNMRVSIFFNLYIILLYKAIQACFRCCCYGIIKKKKKTKMYFNGAFCKIVFNEETGKISYLHVVIINYFIIESYVSIYEILYILTCFQCNMFIYQWFQGYESFKQKI